MPKLKTHKGAAKRIKRTATDKLLRRKKNLNHFLAKKSTSRKRSLSVNGVVTGSIAKNLKRVLGSK